MTEFPADFPGVLTFSAVNVETGRTLARDADAPVRTASVIKVPVMVEAFFQVAAGTRAWEERLTVDAKAAVGGSGVLNALTDGLQITLRDAVVLMIIVSDNTATNLVLDALSGGPAAVNTRMRNLGLKQTTIFRKAFSPDNPGDEDGKKFGLGRTTAREMTTLLAGMARGELISSAASTEMLDILKKQQYRDGIPAGLETSYATATKSGSVEGLRNDIGLVFPPEGSGPLALTIFCDSQPPGKTHGDDAGLRTIAGFARALVDQLLA